MNEPGAVHGLTKRNILATLPVALQGDKSVTALADAIAEQLANRPEEIERLRIYPNIGRQDEKLLDILAYDFKVDWWDPDYSLEEKRRTLANSWRVHKILGTKAAVETAIRAIYPHAEVREWFEYGGKPYHFKLNIDLTGELSDAARPYRVLDRVNFYKSLRSHVEEIVFTIVVPAAKLHFGGGVGTAVQIGVPQEPDEYDFRDTLHMGGAFGAEASVGILDGGSDLHFQTSIQAGGVFGRQVSLPVPENPVQPPATTILRTGGVCTIISNLSRGD